MGCRPSGNRLVYTTPMTLNNVLYDHVHEEEGCKSMPVNDFGGDDDDPLKEQPTVNDITTHEAQDPSYIIWQIFNEIPERFISIVCECYVDKNGKPLDDETTTKHLTDESSNFLGCADFDDSPCYYIDHKKHDMRKISKQIMSKKFICEVPFGSGKSTAICR